MNMTTEDAMKYLGNLESAESNTSTDTSSVEVTESDSAPQEETPAPVANDNNEMGGPSNDEIEAVSDETVDNESKVEKKERKQYTEKERRDFAFAREKQKRRAQKEHYEKRIAELEAEVNKYKGLKLEDFKGDTESYVNYTLDQRDKQREIESHRKELEAVEHAELDAENERRINLSFADENERQEYKDLLEQRGEEFLQALEQFDPEHTVLNYLNEMERYPLVLKKLMTDTEALKSVFARKDSTFRKLALEKVAKSVIAPAKKPLPIIGKQVTSNGAVAEPVHDTNYWNEYLKTHPRGK